ASINAFGLDLLARLTAGPAANVVFSPTSIGIALAMTAVGARGLTLEEMKRVLHADAAAPFDRSMNAMGAALEGRSRTDERGAVTLEIANSLWGQRGTGFEPPFLDTLATEYGAGLQLVDYRADAEGARTKINAWVDEATNERIPELLAPGVLNADSRLTLVNAVYLKANWAEVFDAQRTAPAPFQLADGTTVDVPMMHLQRHFGYAEGDGWQAVELPYVFGELAMTVVVGDGDLDGAINALADHEVILSFPKFDIETSTSLAEVLGALGMPTAFTDSADFTGMTTDEPLHISDVIHQANITVDEEGTEAAAATAVVMTAGAAPAPGEPVTMVVDRPFTFALRDVPTGAVVFLGRVGDPSQGRS
ncbi:unnamed protein product, partial [Phaeothamnion confervicola]